MQRLATLVACVVMTACAPAAPEPAAPTNAPAATAPTPDPDAAFAPRPYTAEQIRDASKAGRTITFVTEVPGKPPQQTRMRFMVVDDERATIVSETLDDTGKVIGDPETETSTWQELLRHASFPKDKTTITDAVAEVPAGSFPCKRYTVVEGTKKKTLCFANELPGPPVEMTIEEDGKLLFSMALIKNEPGE